MVRTGRIVIAFVFSRLYVGLYPMLTGHSIIYFYPYWSPIQAAAYVAGGIVLQGAFCYNWRVPVRKRDVAAQVLMGLGYLVSTVVVSGGGPYQS
jgi:hypothetical protein